MTTDLPVLHCGNCEELKLGFHATALGLSLVMGLYNAAAWLSRREPHLAINAALYAALTAWEQRHVAHHLVELRRPRDHAFPSFETACGVAGDSTPFAPEDGLAA
jgi:hypothetical protein